MNNPKILAILAAYNLEDTIMDLVEETSKFVYYVMVVADGSTDNTARNARKSGAITPDPTKKRGKGYAIIKGINASKKYCPDIVVLLDADGQHLPEEIPIVIDPIIKENVDMVIGSRMLGELKTSKINKIGNLGLKIISLMVTGKWLTDTESGFKAFKANKLHKLKLNSIGYEIESELLLKTLYNKFTVKEVPIRVPCSVSGIAVTDGIKVGLYKIKTGMKLKFGIDT